MSVLLVDKVARAISEAAGQIPDALWIDGMPIWTGWKSEAKAAIAAALDAIAEPSEAMIEDMCRAQFDFMLGMSTGWDETRKFAAEGNYMSAEIRSAQIERTKASYRAMIAALRAEVKSERAP